MADQGRTAALPVPPVGPRKALLPAALSALLREHVELADGSFCYRLDHVPVLDNLAIDDTEDVDHRRTERHEVVVECDEVRVRQDTIYPRLNRRDRSDEATEGLSPGRDLGIMLNKIIGDELVDDSEITGTHSGE